MLKKLKATLAAAQAAAQAEAAKPRTGTGIVFDPQCFSDPVAVITQWTPIARRGANFRTHKLKELDPQCLSFKATLRAVILALTFILFGSFLLLVAIDLALSEKALIYFILPPLFGLAFLAAGAFALYQLTQPIVFDKTQGYFWKGRAAKGQSIDSLNHFCPLKQIHAIQLISEYCKEKTSAFKESSPSENFYSIELNLVLQNGQRFNVIDHGDYPSVREDAGTLALFLNVPLWDACG